MFEPYGEEPRFQPVDRVLALRDARAESSSHGRDTFDERTEGSAASTHVSQALGGASFPEDDHRDRDGPIRCCTKSEAT